MVNYNKSILENLEKFPLDLDTVDSEYYEKVAKQIENIDLNDLKVLKKYNYDNLINYLLQYPIANIISNYLIEKKGVNDIDFVDECLKINLYDLVGTEKNKNLRLN